jgi:hypothetical protein
MNLHFLGVVMLLGIYGSACSPGPAPVSRSMRDPSNPSAPEGVLPTPAGATSPGPANPVHDLDASGEHAGHQHQHGTTSSTREVVASENGDPASVYVCAMHPDVTSSAPGRCPKCGMDLVPKK